MSPRRSAKDFPVVCVGGSAGGLDAYTRLLRRLPNDTGVAIVIVIVNHMRMVATQLPEILPRFTGMPVDLITDGMSLRPNHVFIIPARRDLHVLDGEFHLTPISKPRGWPDDPNDPKEREQFSLLRRGGDKPAFRMAAIHGSELQRRPGIVFQAGGEPGVWEGMIGQGGHVHYPAQRSGALAIAFAVST